MNWTPHDVFLVVLLVLLCLLPYSYLLTRSVSKAYFRSKFEHNLKSISYLSKGSKNGDE